MTTKILPHSDICEDADTSSEQGKGHRTSAPLERIWPLLSLGGRGSPMLPTQGHQGLSAAFYYIPGTLTSQLGRALLWVPLSLAP